MRNSKTLREAVHTGVTFLHSMDMMEERVLSSVRTFIKNKHLEYIKEHDDLTERLSVKEFVDLLLYEPA